MTRNRERWRLLIDGAADGARNMARDEALLDTYAAAGAPPLPTVRFYGWSPAALSLGRAQDASRNHDPAFLRGEGIDLVRRPTGGLAVLHEHERTYAIVGRSGHDPFRPGVLETYEAIAAALERALAHLGVAARSVSRREGLPPRRPDLSNVACFAAPTAHEIVTAHGKLIGSAQLRRGAAFLQHGSILIRSDPARLASALGVDSAAGATDLERETGRRPSAGEIDAALSAAFEESWGVRLDAGELEPEEALRATRLRSWKYDSAAWTLEGRLGERERRWGALPG